MSRPGGAQRPSGGFGLPNGPASGVRPTPRPPISAQSTGQSGPPSGPPSTGIVSPPPLSGSMTRAERFEDEKRRIIDSCFAKVDEQAHRKFKAARAPHVVNPRRKVQESYITHIRVVEDAQFPQTPPPPDSPPQNKKERVIIVAVKNTGRVRIHKARENNNKTFSIGKTWNMDDFSAVQSFSHFEPRSGEEAQWKQWAGDVGFTVSIGKAYYWCANTPKEKEFFIASLVKIYRKYTKGKNPELTGFSPREEEQLLGEAREGSRPRQPPRGPPLSAGPNQDYFKGGPLESPDALFSKTQTPDSMYDATLSEPRSAFSKQTPSPVGASQRNDSAPQLRPQRSRDQDLRKPPSREQLRPTGRITPQSSRSDMASQRDATPDSLNIRAPQPPMRSPERNQIYDVPIDAVEAGSEGPANGLGISRDRYNQNNASGTFSRTREPMDMNGSTTSLPGAIDEANKAPVPERRRPPMLANGSERSIPPSLSSPRYVPPAAASQDSLLKTARPMPGSFYPSPAPSNELEKEDSLLPAPLHPSPKFPRDSFKSQAQPKQPEAELGDPAIQQGQAPAVKPPEPEPGPEEEKKEPVADEEARPGLGRMFGNKKSTRDLFQKAANAYTAFKPRAGGAAARLKAMDSKTAGEPDGITGVVPAPPKRTDTEDSRSSLQTSPVDLKSAQPAPLATTVRDTLPDVTVTSPISTDRGLVGVEQQEVKAALTAQQQKAKLAEEEAARRRKRRSAQQAKYLSLLGIDPALFEGRGLEFETVLDDFGWTNPLLSQKIIEQMEADVRREISRVEAGSWLGHLEQKDERVEQVERMLDTALGEIDVMEGLLTLYGVELSSLNEDIAYIEAQSQGLQVQTANQKLLQSELQALVDTISITPRQLEPLRRASPGSIEGLEAIESSLLILYRAMVTIDPNIKEQSSPDNKRMSVALASSELSMMAALQEKRETYMNEAVMFISRFQQFMDLTFGAALLDTRDAMDRRRTSTGPSTKLSVEDYDVGRRTLWKFCPLVLFVKEINMSSWDGLLRSYQARAKPIYQDAFRDNVQLFKRMARKASPDEAAELSFISTEKDDIPGNLTSAARKLTVKRSQTLAKSLRSASGEKIVNRSSASLPNGSVTSQQTGLWPFEVFSQVLEEFSPVVFTEQNFITEFFHASTSSFQAQDFPDAVMATPPESRKAPNLYARKMFDADRIMARRIADIMDSLFESVPQELQSLIEWSLKADPLQGIGILSAIQHQLTGLEDTNQDFLTRTLSTLQGRLVGLWNKFIDEQIRAIEDTKVKIKTRKGVIRFMRVFPNFSAAVENQLPPSTDEPPSISEVRSMVDKAYERINKAMFESLRIIAKESPGMTGGHSGGSQVVQNIASMGMVDPEDKEALNYHILLIENMNHYHEEVDTHGDYVLEEGKRRAAEEEEEHLSRYVDAVVRRPLGKILVSLDAVDGPDAGWLKAGFGTRERGYRLFWDRRSNRSQDFTESLDHLLSLLPESSSPSSLAARPSTSRAVFKKLLAAQDSRELRRGIEALRKRVEKHFGEGDEPGLARGLVSKVWRACEERFVAVAKRVDEIGREIYDGEGMPWVEEREIERWFRGPR